jgi:hypothetical protein
MFIGDDLGRREMFVFGSFSIVVIIIKRLVFNKAPQAETACIRSRIESSGYLLPDWQQ